ncbi:hypothetical protein [Kitasatospora sp. NBC_01266]|uniref:hypothetical protein n=1 Tax=Kitasatospora sp. NBC_01266 TaxID=2903572 RepID=UPI002E2EC8D3|nr:hypothetical protein [Kitasatospora sp. NBC_01266]
MSTRSIIARLTPDGFAGRYVHEEGCPIDRVPILLTAIQEHFAGDIEAAARFYLDDHPAGWLSLGTDFTIEPTYHGPAGAADAMHNRCFCHGRDDEGPTLLTHASVDPLWHEWIYLLRPDGLQIIRTDWRKCTQDTWASHLLPWTTNPHSPLPTTLRH